MKPLLLLLAVSIGFPATAQTNEHPVIHQLVTKADAIAVGKVREPQIWVTSELIVMTGQATALVERTLKGEKLPPMITVQVVRHLDIENMALQDPEEPKPNGELEFPVTPATPSKFISVDDTDQLQDSKRAIVFLRRSKNGTLNAVDGFLFTLPYTRELEGVVSAAVECQAQQAVDGNPASLSELDVFP